MSCKLDIQEMISNLPAIHLFFYNKWIRCYVNKTETNLASAEALAARCVRVIHAQCVLQFALLSRTLLRSSSNNEPSDPPYRIIILFCILDSIHIQWQTTMILLNGKGLENKITTYELFNHEDFLIHMKLCYLISDT